ncbi:hypothetical protein BDZ89DRAFT_1145352 [Hymenopellis radicata]|nr:hypothetical protein BDZ89DRAFT_1145352 [Hymenopellis radicata]
MPVTIVFNPLSMLATEHDWDVNGRASTTKELASCPYPLKPMVRRVSSFIDPSLPNPQPFIAQCRPDVLLERQTLSVVGEWDGNKDVRSEEELRGLHVRSTFNRGNICRLRTYIHVPVRSAFLYYHPRAVDQWSFQKKLFIDGPRRRLIAASRKPGGCAPCRRVVEYRVHYYLFDENDRTWETTRSFDIELVYDKQQSTATKKKGDEQARYQESIGNPQPVVKDRAGDHLNVSDPDITNARNMQKKQEEEEYYGRKDAEVLAARRAIDSNSPMTEEASESES